ncbi:MAG TPA: thioesterase family protein [Bryobacteraceae bacterium]|nr:thioesterase family protein [Bryobacteraceae bacterium]
MPEIPLGAKTQRTIAVTDENAIRFLGHEQARVLATPWLIAYLEMVARDTVKPWLLDGFDTVGTHVNVRHLAATPLGMNATFAAEIIAVNDRRVTFRVEAWDELDRIAEGTHERAIVDISRFAGRVQSKLNR